MALVTGAGSGIGQATAVRLAGEGAVVVGSDINAAGLEETAGMIDDGIFHPAVSDVRSRDACHELVATVVADHGRLDVLCNIAGVARGHRVGDVDQETWDLILGVNLEGVFWMSQAALPHLESSGGCIVNMASQRRAHGPGLHRAVLRQQGSSGVDDQGPWPWRTMKTDVRINAIAPGGVETSLGCRFRLSR